jgi:hypothetical protein
MDDPVLKLVKEKEATLTAQHVLDKLTLAVENYLDAALDAQPVSVGADMAYLHRKAFYFERYPGPKLEIGLLSTVPMNVIDPHFNRANKQMTRHDIDAALEPVIASITKDLTECGFTVSGSYPEAHIDASNITPEMLDKLKATTVRKREEAIEDQVKLAIDKIKIPVTSTALDRIPLAFHQTLAGSLKQLRDKYEPYSELHDKLEQHITNAITHLKAEMNATFDHYLPDAAITKGKGQKGISPLTECVI